MITQQYMPMFTDAATSMRAGGEDHIIVNYARLSLINGMIETLSRFNHIGHLILENQLRGGLRHYSRLARHQTSTFADSL